MTRFDSLLDGYIHNQLSEEELDEFLSMVQGDESLLKDPVLKDLQQNSFPGLVNAGQKEKMFAGVLEQGRQQRKVPVIRGWHNVAAMRGWYKVAAAAILILFCSGVYFIYFRKDTPAMAGSDNKTKRFKNDVAPGHTGAILTLSNGSQVILDSAHNGALAKQGGAQLFKQNGQLSYETGAGSGVQSGTGVQGGTGSGAGGQTGGVTQEVVYNTMSTPRGRQYQLVLTDGTKVWLNAASSIRYPTVFEGRDRTVEITGEVYFEVAKNPALPFKVTIATPSGHRGEVQVLGTNFNINAYEDDATIRTTLLNGSVRVGNGSVATLLGPGQQAALTRAGELRLVNGGDMEEIMAWKNGVFQFGDASVETIMKQAARWYDADIVYEGRIPYSFVATISRDVPISKLLLLLELTGKVHFRIDGKKITVMP